MSIEVRSFHPEDADAWDTFCQGSLQATLLHSRRFLSYHGDRFVDCSVILEEAGEWLGVFPAALDPGDAKCVVSHPGATYGGLVNRGKLQGARAIEALTTLCRHYANAGYDTLLYKAVPSFYHSAPAQDDLYALFRLGAIRVRCDISSTIDLSNRLEVSQRRRRSLNKAVKAGVSVVVGDKYLAPLWSVLTENLARKHAIGPVHTYDEISLLALRFPEEIRCVCGLLGGEVVAGILLFQTRTTFHAQYIASSERGYSVSALDAVLEHSIGLAETEARRWFDFGISSTACGSILNEGLYEFKSEFGGGGTLHEFFQLDLRNAQ